MNEAVIAVLVAGALIASSLGSAALYRRLPEKHRQAETEEIVRLIANIFVVLASLVLGLMISSARGTFDSVDKAVHAYATELILLDRTMRHYGPDTDSARRYLQVYTKQAAARMAQSDPVLGSRPAEALLNDVGNALRNLAPADPDHVALKARLEQRFETVYAMRWALVEQSEGTIPLPLIALTAAWLVVVFASYGYRAPGNPVMTTSFVASALLIAGTIYLTLDMDVPFDGTIQVSPMPLERALAEMQK
ncbi:MAG: hypothetical protein KIT48_12725 [Pseudolabrys sp.]|jgi:hypothetical protein|nr:hypothetical protein [Pseudolabrys sp.]